MSDRPRDQQPPGNVSAFTGEPASPRNSPVQTASHPPHPANTRRVTSPVAHHVSNTSLDLPPLPAAATQTTDSLSPSASRLTSFSSILNPLQSEEPSSTRRRKVSELESPHAPGPQSLPRILTRGPITNTPGLSPRTRVAEPVDRPTRRILTPRSPSLHRAASLNQLNQSYASTSSPRAQFVASPRSRTYAIEPGVSGAPPLPGPSALTQASHAQPSYEQPTGRVPLQVTRTRNLSSSASPSTSASDYSYTGQTSPATQYAASSVGAGPSRFSSAGNYALGGPDQTSGGSDRQHPVGIPISSSGGPNVYQMMTLETTSGTVQLPVDVQAASRVADEKRRRNAGASARFRQRRKEKEKESSTTISRLEQQMKEMSEETDFYRRERDYLANVLTQIPGAQHHFPRPPSPRSRGPSTMSLPGPSGTGTAAFPTAHEQSMLSPRDGRNVRRRTSTMSLPGPASHIPIPGTPNQPTYNQPPFGAPLAPPPLPNMQRRPPPVQMPPITTGQLPPPSDMTRQRQQLPGLPQVLQPPSQWAPYQSGQPSPERYPPKGRPS